MQNELLYRLIGERVDGNGTSRWSLWIIRPGLRILGQIMLLRLRQSNGKNEKAVETLIGRFVDSIGDAIMDVAHSNG